MKPPDPTEPSKRAMEPAQADRAPPGAGVPSAGRGRTGAGPPDADEPELIRRAAGGDEAAFRVLVERHRDRAYGLALRVTRSTEDARDVAQAAFVKAWLALPRFRGEARFGTWLHRIVWRLALDRADVLRRRRRRETEIESAGDLPGPAEAPRDERALAARRLERLMAERLSPAQRAVVTLFYWEEKSVDEVARTLGMPAGTVKTHLHRARAALRDGWTAGEETT